MKTLKKYGVYVTKTLMGTIEVEALDKKAAVGEAYDNANRIVWEENDGELEVGSLLHAVEEVKEEDQ